MFDVSLSELMVIAVVALVVIGPERLPAVARTLGHILGRAQRYVHDLKRDIQHEFELDELRKFKQDMENTAQSIHTPAIAPPRLDAESSRRSQAEKNRAGTKPSPTASKQ
jgi:Tat protein translocase TatB subunit